MAWDIQWSCFNFGRCEKDGTYSEGTKNGMLGVVIHEVGAQFLPDDHQQRWKTMDLDGWRINSFVEYLTEELFDNKYPCWQRARLQNRWLHEAAEDQLEPIDQQWKYCTVWPECIQQTCSRPLNFLRETIMGRQLFDYAFKEYARRWAFKHPTPADLFRTMEDARRKTLTGSGEDGFTEQNLWYFPLILLSGLPNRWIASTCKHFRKNDYGALPSRLWTVLTIFQKSGNREDRNIVLQPMQTHHWGFYWRYDRGLAKWIPVPFSITIRPQSRYNLCRARQQIAGNKNMYELTFSNVGGLIDADHYWMDIQRMAAKKSTGIPVNVGVKWK